MNNERYDYDKPKKYSIQIVKLDLFTFVNRDWIVLFALYNESLCCAWLWKRIKGSGKCSYISFLPKRNRVPTRVGTVCWDRFHGQEMESDLL